MRKGPVSSRVALLLRSAEGKPFFASISQYSRSLPQCRVVTIILVCFLWSSRQSAPNLLTCLPTAHPTCSPWAYFPCGGGTHDSSRASKPGEGRGGGRRGISWRGRQRARGVLACPGGGFLGSKFLVALEESGPSVLAYPGGGFLGQVSCLPWRRLWCEVLLAREEDGPSVLACPGGGGRRDLVKISVGFLLAREEAWRADGGRVLLALEQSGPVRPAGPGRGTWGMSCLPWRKAARASWLAREETGGPSQLVLFQGRQGRGWGRLWCLAGFVLEKGYETRKRI